MRPTRETLRRTALQWAVKTPEGRTAWRHEECVYANFADVFASREEFYRCLDRRRAGGGGYLKHKQSAGEPTMGNGRTPEGDEPEGG